MTPMTHVHARESQAAERYVLGDMTDDEATAFEEHFFECDACGRSLETTRSFLGAVRAAPREAFALESRSTRVRSRAAALFPHAAVALAAGLAAVALLQVMVVTPRLGQAAGPRVIQPTILRVVRAELPTVAPERGAASFLLVVDITSPKVFPRYRLEFRSEAGEPVVSLEAPAPETGTLHVLLPARPFGEGRYAMTLTGLSASSPPEALETYRFRVIEPE